MRRFTSSLVIPCMAFAVASSPPAPAATGSSRAAESVTRTVRFHDLDLTHSAGVAMLYARIRTAANEVCESPDSRALEVWMRVNRCRQEAIDRAIAEVRLP